MKKILIHSLLVLIMASPFTLLAQERKPVHYVTTVEGIKEYVLDNGLQVLLLPDPSQNNMLVNIVYHVGSKHEGYGEKGMAHLLEHMLFKSTKNLGDIKKMLSDKGGNANGTTWYDRTNYYEIFPYSEENLKWSIEMEADRMINATLLQSDLDKEFSVVRNEFEIGENSPTSVLMEKVISAAYLWHNYGNSTIGSKEDVERVKTPQLRRFYEKYYQPDNATLIIAGKFQEDKALEYIETYFSVIPRPKRVLEEILTTEPAQDGEKFIELKRAGDSQNVSALYHTASFSDKDYATLEVLKEILTSDPSGYLYKALVETHKAASIWAYQPGLRDPGFMYFGLEVSKDKDIEKIRNDFRAELDKIGSIAYTDQDVERAKTKINKDIENIKNNTLSLAISLTEIVGAGDYRLGFLYRDNIEKVTKEEVQRVANKYFRANNRTTGVFIPSNNEQRTKPKEFSNSEIKALTSNYEGREQEADVLPFEATISHLKAHYKEGVLDNGLKYGVIDKQIKGKKVLVNFILPVGNAKDLENKAAIGSMTAGLINSGTKSLTKEQIKDKLNALKASVSFYFNAQTLYINVNTYEASFEETMHIVHLLLTEATFPEAEMEKYKNEQINYLESNLNDPQALAFTEIERMTDPYPKNSVFYTMSIQEEIDAVKAVTQKQIVDFYHTILGSNHGVGTVIGLSDEHQVARLLNKTFKDFNSKVKYERILPNLYPTKLEDKKIITQDKENAAVAGRQNLKMNIYSADYPAFLMANEILGSGGFLGARIPMRLREKEGISYGAGSSISTPIDNEVASWRWYAYYNPSNRDAVQKAIKEEVTLALKDGFTEKELKDNILSWKNSRKTRLASDNTLLSLSNSYLLRGLKFDEYDSLEKKVEALSLKDVNTALRKYLKPEQISSIYVGDFDKK